MSGFLSVQGQSISNECRGLSKKACLPTDHFNMSFLAGMARQSDAGSVSHMNRPPGAMRFRFPQ
jgi:hypothetical protein